MSEQATVPIVDFLRARYDEMEAAAKSVSIGPHQPEHWSAVQYKNDPRGWRVDGQHSCVVDSAFGPDAVHIALHDPKHVLADIAAKRRILGWANSPALPEYETSYVLTALAAPFRAHADFDPAWTVDP